MVAPGTVQAPWQVVATRVAAGKAGKAGEVAAGAQVAETAAVPLATATAGWAAHPPCQ